MPLIRSHVGLRGVAALLVVAYHLQFGSVFRLPIETATALPRRGYLAVDLFFILSGFIISYVNHADRARPMPWTEIVAFWRARFARLYPLLAFSLALMLLLAVAERLVFTGAGRPDPVDLSGRSLAILASQMLLLNAWIPGFVGWNIPSWSISAEIAAYLLFPALVAWRARGARLFVAAGLLSAAIFYGTVALATQSLDVISGLAPLRCLAGFVLGMLIFFARARFARWSTAILSAVQLVSATAILLLLAAPADDPLVIPAYVGLVAATWPDRGLLAWALSRRPLLWLGDISYSVYLNHVGVMSALGLLWPRVARWLRLDATVDRTIWIVLVFAGVLVWSNVTFRYVERPARRWLARRLSGRRASPIAASPPGP